MKPIEPEELSAVLDGELSPEREAMVRELIAADPVLRQEFARLLKLDAGLRAIATTAAFVPHVDMPKRTAVSRWIVGIGAAAGLTLARMAPKYLNSVLIDLTVNSVVLVVLLVFVIWLVRIEADGHSTRIQV